MAIVSQTAEQTVSMHVAEHHTRICTIRTAMDAAAADKKRFEENQAVSPAKTSAAIPASGFDVTEKIAGTVMTDNVAYGI